MSTGLTNANAGVRQFAAFDDQMRMVAGVTGSVGSEFSNLTELAQRSLQHRHQREHGGQRYSVSSSPPTK